MIEIILCGSEIFFGRFRMKGVDRHALSRGQVLREETSYSGESFITGNQLDLSGFDLSNSPPHFRKLQLRDLRRNILRQTFD